MYSHILINEGTVFRQNLTGLKIAECSVLCGSRICFTDAKSC